MELFLDLLEIHSYIIFFQRKKSYLLFKFFVLINLFLIASFQVFLIIKIMNDIF